MKTAKWLASMLLVLFWSWPLAAAAAPQAVSVDYYHMIVMPENAGTIRIIQVVLVNNSGPALEKAEGLTFPLPPGYQQLNMQDVMNTSNARVEGDRLVYSGQVPQGQLSLGFSYALQTTSPHFSLPQELPLGANTMEVLVPSGISVDGLPDRGTVDMGGQQLHSYGATQVPAGTKVALLLTVGSANSSGASGSLQNPPPAFHNPGHIRLWSQSPFSGINAHLFLAIVILVPLAAVAFYVTRRRRAGQAGGPVATGEEGVFQRLRDKEQALLARLAQLEEQHSNGEVEAGTYQELREAYRRRLVRVKAQLRSFTE